MIRYRGGLLLLAAWTACSTWGWAQPTNYQGGRQDPRSVQTYRADVGIRTLNIEAPGSGPQASNIILKANTPCDVVVVVQSNSDLILAGYRLVVSIDGQPVSQQAQGSLRPHEAVTHRIRQQPAKSGQHQLIVTIEPSPGTLGPNEDNPRNNHASLAFVVEGGSAAAAGGLPDLMVDRVNPREVQALDKVILEIGIGNAGGSDVTVPVELEVTVAGQSRRVQIAGGIPAGKTGFASVEILTAVWRRDPHCQVTIDPANRIREANKGNNIRRF